MKKDVISPYDHSENKGAYAGHRPFHGDPRRAQEYRDGDMIHEDYHAIANLPQEVMMKEYSMLTGSYMYEGSLDDTATGIDRQRDHNASMQRKHGRPQK